MRIQSKLNIEVPKQMLKAQETLNRVWEAINSLEAGNYMDWQSLWTTAITGLRSTGHVLHKVDAKTSTQAEKVIADKWQQWKSDKDSWFCNFIEPERNRLLKEGKGLPECSVQSFGEHDEIIQLNITLDNGDDGIYVLKQAADWLQGELNEISDAICDS